MPPSTEHPPVRLRAAFDTSAHPPAIWTAFARQGAWKSWVLLLQLVLLLLLTVSVLGLASREPDVVLVTPDGKSTYTNRSIAGDALVRFLAEQRHRPSDITIGHFSRDFLESFLAVNSSTIEHAWQRSLDMMGPGLRERITREAAQQKLVESLRAAQVQTSLSVENLELVEQLPQAVHVRATLVRNKQPLGGGPAATDRLEVDLIADIVARTPAHPDGLRVAEYRHKVLEAVPPSTPEVPSHAR
jgi:hypothetical protein